MEVLIEIIGLLAYVSIFLIVLIIVLIRSNEKQRKMLTSLIFLFIMIFLTLFIYIPIIQFILFLLIISDLYFIIYVHILPNFYNRGESALFFEREREVWEDLKVQNTIVAEKEEKKR